MTHKVSQISYSCKIIEFLTLFEIEIDPFFLYFFLFLKEISYFFLILLTFNEIEYFPEQFKPNKKVK